MKGSRPINVRLNAVLRIELTAINQYFLHARMLKNWGFAALGTVIYKDSIAVMKEADALVERILFLEGLPNLQDLGKLLIGEDLAEILGNNLALTAQAQAELVKAIAECEVAGDYVSRDLLCHHLEETEERVDFHETQIDLIAKLGLANYQQSAIGALGD